MKFYVKIWAKNKVTLMTELGHVLGYYDSVAEALTTCNEWYLHNSREPRQQISIHSKEFELLSSGNVAI